MVQIYNPNVVGKQFLFDVKGISSDKLKTVEMIKPFMDKVVEEVNLNVLGQCSYQFEIDNLSYGATMVYLLSKCHLSIHIFVDEGKITFDLFTCGLGAEDRNIKNIIQDYFGVNFLNIDAYYFTRGN